MSVRDVRLTSDALTCLVVESRDKAPNESGGILVGRFVGNQLFVPEAVGPGPRAMHAPRAFRRDGKYAQRELDRLYADSGGALDYVGEWHSHLLPMGPSSRDRRSMRWVAENPRYALSRPILIIVQLAAPNGWRPVAFQWVGVRLRRVAVEVGPVCHPPGEDEPER